MTRIILQSFTNYVILIFNFHLKVIIKFYWLKIKIKYTFNKNIITVFSWILGKWFEEIAVCKISRLQKLISTSIEKKFICL